MKDLILHLKTKYFQMWKDGIKTEDYREITQYWANRLCDNYNRLSCLDDSIPFKKPCCLNCKKFRQKSFNMLVLTCGYPLKNDKTRNLIFPYHTIEIGKGKEELGAVKDKYYFIIKVIL